MDEDHPDEGKTNWANPQWLSVEREMLFQYLLDSLESSFSTI
jgi:hypothetical protein